MISSLARVAFAIGILLIRLRVNAKSRYPALSILHTRACLRITTRRDRVSFYSVSNRFHPSPAGSHVSAIIANLKLTFHLDHSAGADQDQMPARRRCGPCAGPTEGAPHRPSSRAQRLFPLGRLATSSQ